jgi:hypothetical protein
MRNLEVCSNAAEVAQQFRYGLWYIYQATRLHFRYLSFQPRSRES